MRKILAVIFLVSVCSIARSQNLAFSQVLTYTGELAPTPWTPGPIYTVPAGKVWKVESLYSSATGALGYKVNNNMLKLNGYGGASQIVYPIWLKAGDVIQPYVDNNTGFQTMIVYMISIIEFSANELCKDLYFL